jgi:uncharacterized membrane protein (UPF0136 family)
MPVQFVPIIYGVAVSAVVFVALRAGRDVLVKLALILAASWLCTIVVDRRVPREAIPVVLMVFDVLASIVTYRLIRHEEKANVGIVVLFGFLVEIAIHASSYALSIEGTRKYQVILNRPFDIQLLSVGGGSVYQLWRSSPLSSWLRGGSPSPDRIKQ